MTIFIPQLKRIIGFFAQKSFLLKIEKIKKLPAFIIAALFLTGFLIPENIKLDIISPVTFFSGEVKKTPPRQNEIFGFAPYWVFGEKLKNIDFNVLTTFAYFGIEVNDNGNLNRDNQSYKVFKSNEASEIFNKAHQSGTKVVLTLTQMDNSTIEAFLDNNKAQEKAIAQAVWEVGRRGIDGINLDFEYLGNPGPNYRNKFSRFVKRFSEVFHSWLSDPYVTVSVYASSAKDPKLYDIGSLSKSTDGIFMMAYDFATSSSKEAMPTAPLYGHKEGVYWYDISTAVTDFLAEMPPEKLILGLPWYGYNYPVKSPQIKASVNNGYYVSKRVGRKFYRRFVSLPKPAQTHSIVSSFIKPDNTGLSDYKTGWDEFGQVGFRSYYQKNEGVYRMVFIEDEASLSLKYDFALDKNLMGVGVWALGFEDGDDLWKGLRDKFGVKIADGGEITSAIR